MRRAVAGNRPDGVEGAARINAMNCDLFAPCATVGRVINAGLALGTYGTAVRNSGSGRH